VYRDIYLDRARAVLGPMVSEAEYVRLERERALSQELPLRIQRSVESDKWSEVAELTDRLQAIRHELDQKQRMVDLARDVFECRVVLDPFSPGLALFTGLSAPAQSSLRDEVIEQLAGLARADAARRDFYDARRRAFGALELRASEAASAGEEVLDREAAMTALKSGDIRRVKAVAEAMLRASAKTATAARGPQGAATIAAPSPAPDLSFTFSRQTLAAAGRLGLAARHLVARADVAALRAYAWHPLFSDSAQRIGVKNVPLPEGIDEKFRARLEMLMIHPLVNSGGARHLPPLGEEDVLIEDFPDPEGGATVPRGPLAEALGLPARRAVSRDAIADALHRHGIRIVEKELGLDPVHFRLVCIPPDVHLRLGEREGWGRREVWTHFDGYLVLPNGRLRALAGGDVRFGGLYDLLGIGRDYDSDRVIVRFAVVRRERMTAW
jgi:hypothetical protein